MSLKPWLPVPMTPRVIRLLGATAPPEPERRAGDDRREGEPGGAGLGGRPQEIAAGTARRSGRRSGSWVAPWWILVESDETGSDAVGVLQDGLLLDVIQECGLAWARSSRGTDKAGNRGVRGFTQTCDEADAADVGVSGGIASLTRIGRRPGIGVDRLSWWCSPPMALTIFRQVSSHRLHAATQFFMISSDGRALQCSAHRRQASAQARQDSTISALCRAIMAAERVQNAAQSMTICAILACSGLPAAAWVTQWWNVSLQVASQWPHASAHSFIIAACRGSWRVLVVRGRGDLIVAGLGAIGQQGETGGAGPQHAEHLTSIPHRPFSFRLSIGVVGSHAGSGSEAKGRRRPSPSGDGPRRMSRCSREPRRIPRPVGGRRMGPVLLSATAAPCRPRRRAGRRRRTPWRSTGAGFSRIMSCDYS